MASRINQRVLTVAGALGLALGTSMFALAQPEYPETPESAETTDNETLDNAQTDDVENGEADDSRAFSEWVRSIPKWGCIRGALVSQMAEGDHGGDDFEGPTYGSPEEAAADLGISDRNCAQVVFEKVAAEGEPRAKGKGNAFGHDKTNRGDGAVGGE